MSLSIVLLGLSITSSWGNGHATTYRALTRGLAARGHAVTFLERDVAWYRHNRDLARTRHCEVGLYTDMHDLQSRFTDVVTSADLVIVGSFVPEGIAVGNWAISTARGITAFYDIDTPVTMARLADESCDYLSGSLLPRFDLYLSFTGGPTLAVLEKRNGARAARSLYCAADPSDHAPINMDAPFALGYLGTYSDDRQPSMRELLIEPALRAPDLTFSVAGPQYPPEIDWPCNVQRFDHVAPEDHAAFYCRHRYTLNITRADMIAAGYSPSVRLFEAAACATPIITDRWAGLDTFFESGEEILVADHAMDVLGILRDLPDAERRRIGAAGRARVLAEHTGGARARDLERYYAEAVARRSGVHRERDAEVS